MVLVRCTGEVRLLDLLPPCRGPFRQFTQLYGLPLREIFNHSGAKFLAIRRGFGVLNVSIVYSGAGLKTVGELTVSDDLRFVRHRPGRVGGFVRHVFNPVGGFVRYILLRLDGFVRHVFKGDSWPGRRGLVDIGVFAPCTA